MEAVSVILEMNVVIRCSSWNSRAFYALRALKTSTHQLMPNLARPLVVDGCCR